MHSLWLISFICRALSQPLLPTGTDNPATVLHLPSAAAKPSSSQAAQNMAYLQKASGYDPEKYDAARAIRSDDLHKAALLRIAWSIQLYSKLTAMMAVIALESVLKRMRLSESSSSNDVKS